VAALIATPLWEAFAERLLFEPFTWATA
jgi:hypothetical protein